MSKLMREDPSARTTTMATAGGRTTARRQRFWRVSAIAVGVLCLVGIVLLLSAQWTGPHASPLSVAILRAQIIDGPIPITVYTLGALSTIFLLWRRPTRRKLISAAVATAAGAAVAGALLWTVRTDGTFGVYIGKTITIWVFAALIVVGLAVASLWRASWMRRIVASLSIVLAVLSATLGINAFFGLDPTLGDLVGVSVQSGIRLPPAEGGPRSNHPDQSGASTTDPLWSHWTPPSGMPARGKVGTATIPNTLSGFTARSAEVYLPPAALVPNAPALPLLIMMMGQPGNPDVTFEAGILDKLSSQHQGLAPIVLAVDQIGNPTVDTLCLNTSKHGNVETYITRDVVNWARAHLHVLKDPAHWTVAGYSNGGECAAYFGAKYPQIWGNTLDISGEAFAGSDVRGETVAQYFHGSWAAYRKTWPVTILGAHTYPDSWGVFTVSSDDLLYRLQVGAVSRAAKGAGWKSTYFEVPNGGHGIPSLLGGLSEGFRVLYPRWGLAK